LPAWFERVCDAIGKPEMKSDARFSTNAARFAHADALMAAWEAGLAAKPAAAWEAEFGALGVPSGVVRTISEFAAHSHSKARGALTALSTPGRDGPLDLMGAGVRFEHDGPAFQGGVPALGADTDAVLTAFGFSPDDITQLRA
jgi:crotonobetainyl-CoA:carnitine CoA-transferase CaiB-like acyl-CoA transferase